MNLIKGRIFFIVLIFVFPLLGVGQVYDDEYLDEDRQYENEPGDDQRGEEEKQIRKPEDNVPVQIYTWSMTDDFTRAVETGLDTALTRFHNYDPKFRRSDFVTSLGLFGTPYQSNNFFERESISGDYFLKYYEAYGKFPEEVLFFHTSRPFTELRYSQLFDNRPDGETMFSPFFTQNISPSWNFGVHYHVLKKEKATNPERLYEEIFFNGFTSYEGEKYKLYAAVINNQFVTSETGGLESDESLTTISTDLENFPVNLDNNAEAENFNTCFALTHKYILGKEIENDSLEDVMDFIPQVEAIHTFKYNTYEHNFNEDTPDTLFFPTTLYLSGETTSDHFKKNSFENIFHLNVPENAERKFSFQKRAFIGNDIQKFFWSGDTLGAKFNDTLFVNSFLGGQIARRTGRISKFDITGRFYFTGYNRGDFKLKGSYNLMIPWKSDSALVHATGKLSTETPDFFLKNYRSNHYSWNIGFGKISELRIGGSFEIPKIHLKAGANAAYIDNFIYFNDSLPVQAGSQLGVFAIDGRKDFEFKHLSIRNRILWQQVTQKNYLNVPTWSFFNSIVLKGVIAKVLFFEIGVDTRIHSKYYADAWNPALGQFYVQREKEIGEFPVMDGFINAKLKRTRFFIQAMNFTEGWWTTDYFSALHYPIYQRKIVFGVAWSFYD